MTQREVPTLADASGGAATHSRSGAGAAIDGTPLHSRSQLTPSHLSIPKPETVLRDAEIDQTHRRAIAGIAFNTIGLIAAPLFGGDRIAHRLFVAALLVALANNAFLYLVSDERRYRPRHPLIYFAIAPIHNAGLMYYLGVFGPILGMLTLNLYSVHLGYDRRVARLTLAGTLAPLFALGVPMTFGWLRDPAVVTVSAQMGSAARAALLGCFTSFALIVYAHGRHIRGAVVSSLMQRDEAVRRASHREALFLEARQDLERALQAGGVGRFTDQTLGSYRLGGVIGRGGMGEVYAATHVTTGESAAVKMLLPEVLGRPEYVQRFRREVMIAAALESPNVVRVLEVGDETAPLPYLAMERLCGEDLAQILRREEQLELTDVVELVRDVGHGLAVAEKAGIIHRDLKPQNVFRTEGPVPIWKILDFGVSKLVEGGGTLTRGEPIGTPQYMAPEQAHGRSLDARADLYSLGAIAYRAITGRQPFSGADLGELLVAVVNEMPVRPSALVALRSEVDLVLAIALAKKPGDRFRSAADFADALEAAMAGRIDHDYARRAKRLLESHPWSTDTQESQRRPSSRSAVPG